MQEDHQNDLNFIQLSHVGGTEIANRGRYVVFPPTNWQDSKLQSSAGPIEEMTRKRCV